MSNKFEDNSEEEIKEKRWQHLMRTMLESKWIEITSNEYHRLKREGENSKGYKKTARIGTNFFKLEEIRDKIIQNEFSDLSAVILHNGWVTLISDIENIRISLGKYPNARFRIIEKILEEVKK